MPLVLVLPSTVSSWCLPLNRTRRALPSEQPIGGAVGPTGQRLDGQAVQMLPQPGVAELLGVGVQRVLREGVLGARLAKARLARGIVAGQRPGVLEGFGLAHQPHASARLPQAGVVDLAGRLQPGEQRPFLGTDSPAAAPRRQRRACAWAGRQRNGGAQASGCFLFWMRNKYSRPSIPPSRRPGKHPSRRPFIPRLKIGGFLAHFL